MEEELAKLRVMAEELKEKVECTICMEIPRKGPVPVCCNGHFICSQCLDKRKEDGHSNCATCKVPMGNIKSLLATVVDENVDHKCDFEGCEEMVHFKEYKKHQGLCEHRKVYCPGAMCNQLLSFKEAATHTKVCPEIDTESRLVNLDVPFDIVGSNEEMIWPTFSIDYNAILFFLKIRKLKNVYSLEVVMLGSQEECDKYNVEISIIDDKGDSVISSCFPPHPIGLEQWSNDGLSVTEKALARTWTISQGRQANIFQVTVDIYCKEEAVEGQAKKARVEESEDNVESDDNMEDEDMSHGSNEDEKETDDKKSTSTTNTTATDGD